MHRPAADPHPPATWRDGSRPPAAEGWYTDPAGRHPLRWWDGVAWTEEVRTRSGTLRRSPLPPGCDAPPPASALAPATEPDIGPRWALPLIGMTLIVVAVWLLAAWG